MLPAAMRFNLSAAPDKFLRMAQVVNPTATRGEAFIDWSIALSSTIGIPTTLSELGVSTDRVEVLVNVAIDDGCHPLNPRSVDRNDFYAIYQDALAI